MDSFIVKICFLPEPQIQITLRKIYCECFPTVWCYLVEGDGNKTRYCTYSQSALILDILNWTVLKRVKSHTATTLHFFYSNHLTFFPSFLLFPKKHSWIYVKECCYGAFLYNNASLLFNCFNNKAICDCMSVLKVRSVCLHFALWQEKYTNSCKK